MKRIAFALCAFLYAMISCCAAAQCPESLSIAPPGQQIKLHSGWLARQAQQIALDGNTISQARYWNPEGWMPATVPGTVLTTLLNNGVYPAPEKSLNNKLIPDIYNVGRDFYTYWFVKPFSLNSIPQNQEVWLNFRGINYMADIFLNGRRVNSTTHEGMFLRRHFNITKLLRTDSLNVLAVIVYPPLHPGNPNGGQGGDGMIARNVTMQYTPGWDWIQTVHDRNTGIWDEVTITTTGSVRLSSPYVVTKVPGIRRPSDSRQADAQVKTSVELENTSNEPQTGILTLETAGTTQSLKVSLKARESREIALKDVVVKNPKLWWPNGIGEHPLYQMQLSFAIDGKVSDATSLRYGIREISTEKDAHNGGRKFFVNGQKIYITGGNYINSDWLLRLSSERYRDELRFHADMNVRMIRVWGGALLERPEFYDAADEEGILVMQDLWGSGDCNGAWEDAQKLESRERRWEYPDNHPLFLASARDQIKMIRNHPSLCFWCGANEWPLAADIDETLTSDIMPKLDPERLFVHFSTDTTFTRNRLGDNGDGPYGIMENEWFFTFRSHPFNPEAGSVGAPEIESFREFMTEGELNEFPRGTRWNKSLAWNYHKDLGYGNHLSRYGEVTDIETYCRYAQVVGYDQYRSFMEGWASHMWDWYTGILIWKTQNPWTALRGQMYDWYLDVNATLYGTMKGCETLHPFFNIVTRKVQLLNSGVEDANGLTITAEYYNINGKQIWQKSVDADAAANSVSELFDAAQPADVNGVYFLKLSMAQNGKHVTQNIYWLTTTPKDYTTLHNLPATNAKVTSEFTKTGDRYTGQITLSADGKHISFFNRIKLFNKATGKRILPVHYSDNYITLMPADSQTINVDFPARGINQSDIEVRLVPFNP